GDRPLREQPRYPVGVDVLALTVIAPIAGLVPPSLPQPAAVALFDLGPKKPVSRLRAESVRGCVARSAAVFLGAVVMAQRNRLAASDALLTHFFPHKICRTAQRQPPLAAGGAG